MSAKSKCTVAFLSGFLFLAGCEMEGQIDFRNEALSAQQLAVDWMKHQYSDRQSFEVSSTYQDFKGDGGAGYGFEFEGGGFVIVSSINDELSIIAYGNDNSLVSQENDDSLARELIHNLKVIVDNNHNSYKKTDVLLPYSRSISNVVEPLITSTWGQSGGYSPNFTYNKATPLVNAKDRAPVGCVAVAFGQVLNYYQFPKQGIGYSKYCSTGKPAYSCSDGTIVEADFRSGFDWSNMTNKLTYSSSTAQVDAVSKLLLYVGASVNARYTKDGAFAQIANPSVFNGFRRSFKMTEVAKVNKSDYSDSEWEALIKNEIINQRPVVLFGEDSNIGAGHAYIVDGIDKNGYVHVNWGWNGSANGYYNLSSLVIDGRYNFTDELSAYINFVPPIKTVEKTYKFTVQPGEWLDVEAVVGSGIFNFDTVDDIQIKMAYDGPWAGDADLYVKKGSKIANPDDFDCAPKRGSSMESCYLKGKGKYFITINGYNEHGQKSPSPISLKVTYKEYQE